MSQSTAIRAGDPRGLELESDDAICRYAKERFGHEDREERESLLRSGIERYVAAAQSQLITDRY